MGLSYAYLIVKECVEEVAFQEFVRLADFPFFQKLHVQIDYLHVHTRDQLRESSYCLDKNKQLHCTRPPHTKLAL